MSLCHIKGQMEEHSSSAAAAGRAIEPLRNLDDVAVFAKASSVAPEGLRDRAGRVAQHMQSAGGIRILVQILFGSKHRCFQNVPCDSGL